MSNAFTSRAARRHLVRRATASVALAVATLGGTAVSASAALDECGSTACARSLGAR